MSSGWGGTSALVCAPSGPAAGDYIQIALARESEWRAGPIVNPDYRPFGDDELFDPNWLRRVELAEADRLVGPIYRLLDRAGGALVHLRSFLGRCDRIERERREGKRPELERRAVQETGPGRAPQNPFPQTPPAPVPHRPPPPRFLRGRGPTSPPAQPAGVHLGPSPRGRSAGAARPAARSRGPRAAPLGGHP